MPDYSHRISNLSPERRQLLARLLQTEGNKYNVFPLSFAQQRMWFLYQMEPASPFYNVALKLHFKGALILHAVEQALNEILRRHEVLRTTFSLMDGSPVQIISAPIGIDLPVLDLRGLSAAEREREVGRITEEESRRPFELEKGPVLRTTLLRLDEQEHTLLLVTHHIVVDGWAIGILVREFASLYEAFAAHRPSPLPPLALQYVDFARQQQEWLEGKVQEAQLAYWQQQLKGSRYVLDLPSDLRRPAMQTYRGSHQSVCFSEEMSASIKLLCQSEGVTLFMFMLAAFNLLLHRYTGETDISVGSAISGRQRVETEGLIGFFANTLVLRHNLSDNPSFTELLKQVRRNCLEAYAHQDLPFEKLVEVLQPERDLSRAPLVQVVFSLQNDSLTQHTPMKALSLPGLSINLEVVNTSTVQFDLVLTVEDTEREFGATLSYNADLFEAATISRMLRRYQMLLEEIVRAPEQPLSHFSLLSASQRRSLRALGSGPARPLSPA
ncbi:MAG TPA: condensation domain-containing protein, partial [Pyrinomonadaceae bacterium]|nr:condensation domain-containing protein [Pyrinomonadaceae bacterium]